MTAPHPWLKPGRLLQAAVDTEISSVPEQPVSNWKSVNRTLRLIKKNDILMFMRMPTAHEISFFGVEGIVVCLFEEKLVYCVLGLFDAV